MKALYRKIDEYVLAHYPRLWVLGIHFFVPVIALIFLVLVVAGAVIVNTSNAGLYEIDDQFERIAVGMVLPVILLVILFVIRQAKYNSIRVHHKLPTKGRFTVFLAFWFILLGITSLPFSVYFGSYFASGINHNKKSFNKDEALLEKCMSHFYLKGCYNDERKRIDAYSKDNDNNTFRPCDYRLDDRWDTLHLNIMRFYWGYSQYSNGNSDRITLAQAREEIGMFIEVAKHYKASFNTEDVSQILEMNTTGNGMAWEERDMNNNRFYTHIANLKEFEHSLAISRAYHTESQIFRMFNWEFWRYFSLVGFTIAFLLIIFCSANRGEFGWSMLVCALFPTVFGVITGLLALVDIINGEESVQLLLALFIGAMIYVAFMSNSKPKLKRIFGISLNIILPIAIPFITSFDSFDEDEFFTFAFIVGLIVTYLFSFYYQYQYLHPKKS